MATGSIHGWAGDGGQRDLAVLAADSAAKCALAKILNREMTQLLQQVAEHPHRAGLSLLAFSLVYGILHALGPGHGKVVITTFLATHPAKLKTSMKLTLLASLLQGSVAIVLVTLMLVVLHTSSRQLHLSSFWLEKGSYLLVIARESGQVIGRSTLCGDCSDRNRR